MKTLLLLTMLMLLTTTSVMAQAAKLTVEQDGAVTLSRDIDEVQRLDLTGAKAISIVATDGTELVSNLSKAGLKLNFTDDITSAVETVPTSEQKPSTTRKRIINGQLIIETADGKIYDIAGRRVKQTSFH